MARAARKLKAHKRRSQPRLGAGKSREREYSAVIDRIDRHLEHDAGENECSKSWIMHAILAAYYGEEIPMPEGFRIKPALRRVK